MTTLPLHERPRTLLVYEEQTFSDAHAHGALWVVSYTTTANVVLLEEDDALTADELAEIVESEGAIERGEYVTLSELEQAPRE